MFTFFRTLLRYVLFSNLFIAVCAFGLVWQTYLLLQVPVRIWEAVLAFLATFFIYNLDGLLPYKFNQNVAFSERKSWVVQHRKPLLVLVCVSGLAAVSLFFWYVQVSHIWFIAHLVAISLLYSSQIIPRKNGASIPLRNLPLVKVFLIAYVWSCVTVLLLLLSVGLPFFSTEVDILFIRRFSFLFALTLLFDIRDYVKDKVTNTLTFPGLVGVRNTKVFSIGLLVLFSVLTWQTETGPALQALELSAIAAAFVVLFSHEKRNDYYFLILADGMMLLQSLLVYIALQ